MAANNDPPTRELYTIGHSKHSIERLVELLRQHGIEIVTDVRSRPYSRFNPQFNREALRRSLQAAGIEYVELGDSLGGRPLEHEFYDAEGRVLYDRMAASARFQQGLDRLLRQIREDRVAILCSEEDPARCHRSRLIGRELRPRGVLLRHVRADGRVMTQEEVESPQGVVQRRLFEMDEAQPIDSADHSR